MPIASPEKVNRIFGSVSVLSRLFTSLINITEYKTALSIFSSSFL